VRADPLVPENARDLRDIEPGGQVDDFGEEERPPIEGQAHARLECERRANATTTVDSR
jgi:hypothetical protein